MWGWGGRVGKGDEDGIVLFYTNFSTNYASFADSENQCYLF